MFNQEFEQENGANTLLSTIIGVVIRAFLAVTTAGFFLPMLLIFGLGYALVTLCVSQIESLQSRF